MGVARVGATRLPLFSCVTRTPLLAVCESSPPLRWTAPPCDYFVRTWGLLRKTMRTRSTQETGSPNRQPFQMYQTHYRLELSLKDQFFVSEIS